MKTHDKTRTITPDNRITPENTVTRITIPRCFVTEIYNTSLCEIVLPAGFFRLLFNTTYHEHINL